MAAATAKVWGGKNPRFRDLDELNRFTALVMNSHNEIAECFAGAPDRFEPTFYERKVGEKTYKWSPRIAPAARKIHAYWRAPRSEPSTPASVPE